VAEPLSLGIALVELAKLGADLSKTLAEKGYDWWKTNQAAKEKLAAILRHLRIELERNYESLYERWYRNSADEQLETALYGSVADAVNLALRDERAILDLLNGAYQSVTPGLQARLHRAPESTPDTEALRLCCRFGQASEELGRFLNRQGSAARNLPTEDCKHRKIRELVDGWPEVAQYRLCKSWREFKDATRANGTRLYTLAETGAVNMYEEPDREVDLREEAEKYPLPYAFELANGIFELWVSPSVRILFARGAYDLVLLDVVQLAGRQQNTWTPRWYVDRARCRHENHLRS
jgi:hypothetical protein